MADDPTTLSDMVLIPDVFRQYIIEASVKLDAFLSSGIAVDLSEVIEDFGTTVEMPFFTALSGDDDVSDDTQDIVIHNIDSSKDIAAKLQRDKAFGATDLSAELSGADPMLAIAATIGKWWSERRQAALLASVGGAMACANMAGNVFDISALTDGAQYFDGESFIDATHMLGDHANALKGVAVHSDTEKVMKKQDLIDYIKPSTGGEPIPFYQGKRVVVTDDMPVTNGTYTSYIFGPGAVGFAQRPRRKPVERGRDPLKNGGRDYLVTREQWVFHPRGIKWIGTPVKATPSNSELAVAASWTRVWQPKNIRIVKFVHKLTA
jgi:hypothetical protein